MTEPPTQNNPGFFKELTQRRVVQAALVYFAIAWTVTEVLTFLIGAIPVFPAWTSTLVALLFVLGFPVAMFLAWRFDIDRDGVHRTTISSTRGKITVTVSLALLAVATAGLFWLIYPQVQQQTDSRARASFDAPDNSIAVMPFINVGGDPDNEFFALGLPDTVLHKIANLKDLIVIARTSSFALAESDLDATTIGRELNTRYLLEGSVQSFGDELRVIAQLVRTEDASHVWSLDRRVVIDDIFDIQDEIAIELARALRLSLRDEERERLLANGTDSVPAYLEFLKGSFAQQSRSMALFDDALRHFEAALELDPNYARAHLGLAYTYSFMGTYGAIGEPESRRLGLEHIRRAIEIDPSLGAAWAELAQAEAFIEGTKPDPELLQKATELSPNDPTVMRVRADNLCDQISDHECSEAAGELLRKAIRRSPDDAGLHFRYGFNRLFLGYVDEVIPAWSEALRRNPNMTTAYTRLARAKFAFGTDTLGSMACLHEAIERDPKNFFPKIELASVYTDIGLDDLAEQLLIDVESAPGTFGGFLDESRFKLAVYRKDFETALPIANKLLESEALGPVMRMVTDVVYQDAASRNDLDSLSAKLESLLDERADFDPESPVISTSNQVFLAGGLVRTYLALGQRDAAVKLAASMANYYENDFYQESMRLAHSEAMAQIDIWRGDVESALNELDVFPDRWLLRAWYIPRIPEFAALAGNPRFDAIVERIEARLQSEREAVLAAGDSLPACVENVRR